MNNINYTELLNKLKKEEAARYRTQTELDADLTFNQFWSKPKKSISMPVQLYKMKLKDNSIDELQQKGFIKKDKGKLKVTNKGFAEYVKAMLYVWKQIKPRIKNKKYLTASHLRFILNQLSECTTSNEFNTLCLVEIDNALHDFIAYFIKDKKLHTAMRAAEIYGFAL